MDNAISELGSYSIPELNGFENSYGNDDLAESKSVQDDSGCKWFNPAYAAWSYTDHEKKCDFVEVAVAILGGATDINFEISNDGWEVEINYVWPSVTFNPKELFADELNNSNLKSRISLNHPKIHAFKSYLLNCGITENSKPKGRLTVKLPIQVQRENGTWTKKGVQKDDGTRIVMLELKGYQECIIIKDADKSIQFN